LRRVQPSQAQLLNNISRSSRATFKKRKRTWHSTLPHQDQGSRNNLQEEKKINWKEIVLYMQREGSLGCGWHTGEQH
jgi:hypothetical protein